MRQAGRYMPSYRALRARYAFLELCKNSQAAAEVTLQPVEQLGQLDQLGQRVAVGNSVTGDDQRRARGDQLPGRRVHRRPIAEDPGRHARGREEIEIVALGIENVDGQREKDRTARLGQGALHRTADDAWQVLEPMRLCRPLDVRRRHRRQLGPEDRLGHREALVVLTGGEQQRGVRLVRVVQHAHGVAESRRDVDVDGRQATARLRVAVGHRDGHCLLQRQHVADARLAREPVHQRQLGGARIAEHDRHALGLEDLEERLLAGYVCHGARIINRVGG